MLSSELNEHRAPGKTPRPRTQNHRFNAPRAKGLRVKKKDKVDLLVYPPSSWSCDCCVNV
jgi:hypothetical protein